jgi:SAM-dependent methyltransferase
VNNRYDDILRRGNQTIIDLTPANVTLRIVSALEVKRAAANGRSRALEIGIGEGDLAKFIFKYNPEITLDAVDVSGEMIESAKATLADQKDKVNYFCEDALAFLKRTTDPYDVILSSWVIHNFKRADRRALLEEMFAKLRDGGIFILMDKVYPGDEAERKEMFDVQVKRYRYLDKNLRDEITAHEELDYTDEYRIDELPFFEELKSIGFVNVRIEDRVERDVVLVATKNVAA